MGGICICLHNSLDQVVVIIRKLFMGKAMEACAVKCNFLSSIYCILTIYRSSSSNFSLFIAQLETIIKKSINQIYEC
jgi:hypothetical protein